MAVSERIEAGGMSDESVRNKSLPARNDKLVDDNELVAGRNIQNYI